MRTTLLLQCMYNKAFLIGLANTRLPRAILETVIERQNKCCFMGVAITSLGAQLIKNKQTLSEEATPKLTDGTFTTVTLDDERMEVSFCTPLGATWSCATRHGERVDPTHERFCAAIADAPCDIVPCWSIL